VVPSNEPNTVQPTLIYSWCEFSNRLEITIKSPSLCKLSLSKIAAAEAMGLEEASMLLLADEQ
jgi:hypothetical protein